MLDDNRLSHAVSVNQRVSPRSGSPNSNELVRQRHRRLERNLPHDDVVGEMLVEGPRAVVRAPFAASLKQRGEAARSKRT